MPQIYVVWTCLCFVVAIALAVWLWPEKKAAPPPMPVASSHDTIISFIHEHERAPRVCVTVLRGSDRPEYSCSRD